MGSRRILLAVVAVAALLLGWALLGRGGDPTAADGGGGPGGGPGGPAPPPVVTAAEVTRGPYVARAEMVGTLEARASADLYARSAGPVVAMSADVGDRVRDGQVLARIEPAEERQRLEQAQANLKMAEAGLAQRRAALDIAAATAERTAALAEQNLVSQQQKDATAAELAGARAQVDVAAAGVEQARAALSSARVELDQTLVVAPFSGVVGRRYLDLGDLAAANAPVFQLVDLTRIRTRVELPERQAARIEVGRPASVRVRSLPGETFAGRVARISDVFDPRSNTAEAQVEMDNPGRRLKPGMFAQVSIALDQRSEALLVPAAAVLEQEGQSWVFTVERRGPAAGAADGRTAAREVARRVPVQVLGRSTADGDTGRLAPPAAEITSTAPPGAGGEVAVDGDLAAGDRVITLGHEALADGDAVRVADADAGPGAEAGPGVAPATAGKAAR